MRNESNVVGFFGCTINRPDQHFVKGLSPYILVVGDKEKASGAVAVRARGSVDLGVMPLEDFSSKLLGDIAQKA